jgi:hypothetical protein
LSGSELGEGSLEQDLGRELREAEPLKPARDPRGSKSETQVSI